MRPQTRPFRLTSAVAIAALLAAPWPVAAQGVPPPPPMASQNQQAGDPPERVGRLAQLNGSVSFHTQDETQWNAATLNYPVTAGNAFWTETNAQAAIEISASRIVMAPSTELDIATMTDTAFQATMPQGEVYLRLHPGAPDESYAVQTPRGLVSMAVPGRYGIVAGDTENPTLVTVIEGSARVEAPGVALDIGPNQTATIAGTDTFQGSVGPAQRDGFLNAMLESERPRPPQGVAPPPLVAAMPGGEDLAAYGTWSDSHEYGQVWYPQVAQDWVPYRDGRWAYVAPWGWTWVDSAPWGFAPFHYGRWSEINGRWGWIPGRAERSYRPVYAPALVTFIGVGAAVGIGVGAALAANRVGWLPLGPREPFRPWYRTSDRYVRQVNVTHVTNVTNITTINRNVTINNFANRRAATVVPANTMVASRPIAPAVQRLDAAQLAQARPVIGQQPLRPSPTTVGVTPAVARQLSLPPATAGLRPAAPGPSIRALSPTGPSGVSATGHPGVPQLRTPDRSPVPAGVARPGTAETTPATPGPRPGNEPPRPGGPTLATPEGAPGSSTPGNGQPAGQSPNRSQPTTVAPNIATPGGPPALRAPGNRGPTGQTSPATPQPGPPLATPGPPASRTQGNGEPGGEPPNRGQPTAVAPNIATPGGPPAIRAPGNGGPPGQSPATPQPGPNLATPGPPASRMQGNGEPGGQPPNRGQPTAVAPNLATPGGAPALRTPGNGGPPGQPLPGTPQANPSLAVPGASPGLRAPGTVGPAGPSPNRFQPTAVPPNVASPGNAPGTIPRAQAPASLHAMPTAPAPTSQMHSQPPGAIAPVAPVRPAPPPAIAHAPPSPPVARIAPVAPPPQVHAPPPPVHVAAPPPQQQMRPSPPAPVAHAPAPVAPHPAPQANNQHKKPGEQ